MGRQAATSTLVVGRDRERAVLLETLDEGGPLVAFVHAPAGMGKSALLGAFVAAARARGVVVVRLDCRAFEPTEHGFLDALSHALAAPVDGVAEAASALARLGSRVVLVIDTYEVFRLSNPWLRLQFVPVLDDRVRVVIAGREPPIFGWFDARGSPDTFRSLLLRPLDDGDALRVLSLAGMPEPDARATEASPSTGPPTGGWVASTSAAVPTANASASRSPQEPEPMPARSSTPCGSSIVPVSSSPSGP